MTDSFEGYRRPAGAPGVRSHVLILPTTVCSADVARHVAARVPPAVAALHQHGCSQVGDDRDLTARVLAGTARNPNVYGIVVVGLGCEAISSTEIADAIAPAGKALRAFDIQEVGGTGKAIEIGCESAKAMVEAAGVQEREPMPLTEITLGTECGGSDAWSGVTANPVIGRVADRLVDAGGAVILSETTEFIGAEHVLARRARTPQVAAAIRQIVAATEKRVTDYGADIRGGNPTPGNLAGGITTLEEKSLGCIHKGGTSVVEEVVAYGEPPTRRGLIVMDTPGQDIESITGMLAGGAQVVVFSTGRGSPVGAVVAPVIKLSTNSPLHERMADDIDFDAGVAIDRAAGVDQLAQTLFERMIAVASGAWVSAERWGHAEFAIHRVGPTV